MSAPCLVRACLGCGYTTPTALCRDCRRDRSLGERLGTTRAEENEWAATDDRYEPSVSEDTGRGS
ncbi:MAG: hypothetical protein H0U46_11860 [Actinobacteria bacterium]|nr:hypothetical protein [Actinomycetota bacterium]